MNHVWCNVYCVLCSLCLSRVQTVQLSTTGTTTRPDWTQVTNSSATQTSGQAETTSQPVTSRKATLAVNSTTTITTTTTRGLQSVLDTIGQFFKHHWYAGLAGGIIIIIIIIIVVVCIARRCRRRPPSVEKEKTRPWNLTRFSIIRHPIRDSILFPDFDVKSDIVPSSKKADLPPVSPKGDKLPNGACDSTQQLYAVPMRRCSAPTTSPSPRSSCMRLYYQSSPLGSSALAAAAPALAAAAPALYDLPPPPPSPPLPQVPPKLRPPSVTYKIPSNIPAVPKTGLPSVRSALDMQATCPSGPSDAPQLPKGGSREQRGRSLLFSW